MSDNTINPENMTPSEEEENKKIQKSENKVTENSEEAPNEDISQKENDTEGQREVSENVTERDKEGSEETIKSEIKPEKSSESARNEDISQKENENPEAQNQIPEEKPESGKLKTDSEEAEKSPGNSEDIQKGQIVPQIKSRSKDTGSNYQISLINQNLLKVNVSTKQGVKLNSTVRNRKTSAETQNNEVYLYPKSDRSIQEIAVLISIEEDSGISNTQLPGNEEREINSENITSSEKVNLTESNYQINLINENLLKVRIETHRGVKIDSVSRDKRTSAESQTNKIYLNPLSDDEIQIVEITIEIDSNEKEILQTESDGSFKLIPNPELIDLIQPPSYPVSESLYDSYDPSDPETGYQNPFDALRKLIQKNTAIGVIVAVILHMIAAGVVYFSISKKAKEKAPEEQSRLIVIQDLPDPKIKLENVDDPKMPKIVEPPVTDENKLNSENPKREVKPRKTIKPPEITRPKRDDSNRDTISEADLEKELDSLRKLAEGNNLRDTLKDSTKTDSLKIAYDIADSLRNNFKENDIGLAMYFPKNWKLTDQREINKSEKEFKGVLLTDTTAEQPGTLTMFIYLDTENKDYNAEDFKTEFTMTDSTLSAFSKEPKTLAGFTEYRFYIFNKIGTEKLSLRASVRKQFFEQYKNEIEAVVRSIRIQKPEKVKKDSL